MEGVERYKVKLVPYSKEWEKEYEETKDDIIKIWSNNILDIQHVGSTAINDICAKPILDVAVRLNSLANMNIEAMKRLGYEFCGARNEEKTYYLFMLRGENQISLKHIHCYGKDEEEYFKLVGFRDYLNKNKNYAKEYASLKEKLAKQYPDNRVLYTAGKEAEHYKVSFEKLLLDTVKLSNGRIRNSVINSGEIFTEYTLETEKKTKYYTGIDINHNITLMEKDLDCKTTNSINHKVVDNIKNLNARAIKLLDGLIDFKMRVLDGMLCCKLFTVNYPLLIEHIIREAKLYRSYIRDLELNKNINKESIRKTELFWDQIMMEHSLFIRGLLDPSENELISTSNKFANEFSELIQKANDATEMTMPNVTSDTLMETIKLRDFKKAGTRGIVDCKIRSIILPLLADHVLREANHYIRLLTDCEDV